MICINVSWGALFKSPADGEAWASDFFLTESEFSPPGSSSNNWWISRISLSRCFSTKRQPCKPLQSRAQLLRGSHNRLLTERAVLKLESNLDFRCKVSFACTRDKEFLKLKTTSSFNSVTSAKIPSSRKFQLGFPVFRIKSPWFTSRLDCMFDHRSESPLVHWIILWKWYDSSNGSFGTGRPWFQFVAVKWSVYSKSAGQQHKSKRIFEARLLTRDDSLAKYDSFGAFNSPKPLLTTRNTGVRISHFSQSPTRRIRFRESRE